MLGAQGDGARRHQDGVHDQNEIEIDHDKDDSRIIRDDMEINHEQAENEMENDSRIIRDEVEIDHEQDEVETDHVSNDDASINQDEALLTFKTYDDSSHLLHYQGDYRSYFPTFTAMALFIWVTKHMISSVAYKDLVTTLPYKKYSDFINFT